MENIYSPAVEDQAKKTAREAQKLGKDVKDEVRRNFDDAVSRGNEAAEELGVEAQRLADRARDYVDSARRKVGDASRRVTTYADDNTALVAVAAFGVGLLVGYLVTRES